MKRDGRREYIATFILQVMFAQSLAHGSDEAQQELQKLTEFLEHEGNLGIIPVDLQKKVLSESTLNIIK